jgi:hypothetical protein
MVRAYNEPPLTVREKIVYEMADVYEDYMDGEWCAEFMLSVALRKIEEYPYVDAYTVRELVEMLNA